MDFQNGNANILVTTVDPLDDFVITVDVLDSNGNLYKHMIMIIVILITGLLTLV